MADETKYLDEKTAKTLRVLQTLSFEPLTKKQIVDRIGYIPLVKVQLKEDSVFRILKTLEIGDCAKQLENGKWICGSKRLI